MVHAYTLMHTHEVRQLVVQDAVIAVLQLTYVSTHLRSVANSNNSVLQNSCNEYPQDIIKSKKKDKLEQDKGDVCVKAAI